MSYCRSEEHVGPEGEIQIVRSLDDGASWSSPIVARDSLIDDREGGMTFLSDGRILLHIWSQHHTAETYDTMSELSYRNDVIDHWKSHVASTEYAGATNAHGGWILESRDEGVSWKLLGSGPDSIHGGIQLDTGEILVAGYRTMSPKIGIFRADPAKMDWQTVTVFEPPKRSDRRFGEPHIAQLESGRVVMMLRSTATAYDDESDGNRMWCTYSDDRGTTWVDAQETELWGFPPHLLTLADGRLLCTYGYRRAPFGERACISEDGISWDISNEIVLRDDADGVDLGYPATIETAPGKFLTVYYQSPHCDPPAEMRPPDPFRQKPDILATRWSL